MAADVITRLRTENPVVTAREPGAHALFAQIVAGPREPAHARRTTPSRRRVALILLAVLAIAAPLAVAARTTGALDFVLGDPAPKSVAQALDLMLPEDYPANEGPPQHGPTRKDVVKGSERVVAEITLRSGGKARLYAVDVRDGSRCFAAIGGPFGAGSCFSPAGVRQFPVIAGAQSGGAGAKGEFAERPVLYGRITHKAGVSLVIRYVDGATAVIPTSGGWFLYELPRVNWLRAHEPLRLDVLDAAGRVVGSLGDLFGLHPPKGPKAEHPLPAHRVLARVPLNWKDAVLEIQVAKSDGGHLCSRVLNTRDVIQTKGWWCFPTVGRTALVTPGQQAKPAPVQFELHPFTKFGKPGGYVYARGWAGPSVASLEIRYQDSTVEQIPLHERFFAWVVPSAHWQLGKRPSYVVARDSSGKAVWRRFLYPAARCSYPVADKRCATIIVRNG